MPKVIRSSRETQQHTGVNDASRVLKRFYVFQRQLMRAFAGWFIATPHVELKFFLAGEAWLCSQHADSLRSRVLELRYPRRDVDKKWDADVLAFTAELMKAPDLRAFLTGVYESALPAFVSAIDNYLERTDPLDDAPSVYRLRHLRVDTQARIEAARQQVEQHAPPGDDPSVWRAYLSAYLESMGGLDGLGERGSRPTDHALANRPAFQIPRSATRDLRFRPSRFHLPHENKYDKAGAAAWKRIETLDKRVAMQVWSAISHFNEIWGGGSARLGALRS
ncbi:MAG: hypothetical protein HC828_16920 [Blastochloris sp.]|nr:hypothetical protein [Blastochloris sp.]